MAHGTETGRRLHPHDARSDTVMGLLEFNDGAGAGLIRVEVTDDPGAPPHSAPASRRPKCVVGNPEKDAYPAMVELAGR